MNDIGPVRDSRHDNLAVTNTLVANKRVVATDAYAKEAVFGTLIVDGQDIVDILGFSGTPTVATEPPLAGDGSPENPITYLPPLTQPLLTTPYDLMASGVYLGVFGYTFIFGNDVWRITVTSATKALIGIVDKTDPSLAGQTLTMVPGDPVTGLLGPGLFGVPTPLLVDTDPAHGIVRWDFDDPLPAGSSFVLMFNLSAGGTISLRMALSAVTDELP